MKYPNGHINSNQFDQSTLEQFLRQKEAWQELWQESMEPPRWMDMHKNFHLTSKQGGPCLCLLTSTTVAHFAPSGKSVCTVTANVGSPHRAKAVTVFNKAIQYLGCSIPLGPWHLSACSIEMTPTLNMRNHTTKSSKSSPEPPDLIMNTHNPFSVHLQPA